MQFYDEIMTFLLHRNRVATLLSRRHKNQCPGCPQCYSQQHRATLGLTVIHCSTDQFLRIRLSPDVSLNSLPFISNTWVYTKVSLNSPVITTTSIFWIYSSENLNNFCIYVRKSRLKIETWGYLNYLDIYVKNLKYQDIFLHLQMQIINISLVSSYSFMTHSLLSHYQTKILQNFHVFIYFVPCGWRTSNVPADSPQRHAKQ